jgi:hypothetical protein
MKEREPVSGRLTDRWRRAATHVVAALNLRASLPSDPYEPPRPTRLGPVPFYSQPHFHEHRRPAQPAPTGEDRGFYRMAKAIQRPADPADYDYPVGMTGFPPPDWMLRDWREQWGETLED